jgi:hypothetical protein
MLLRRLRRGPRKIERVAAWLFKLRYRYWSAAMVWVLYIDAAIVYFKV